MNIRKAIARLALVIGLLGAQHAAIVHVMSHLVTAPEHAAQLERQPTGLAAELCEICVGFAQLGGTIYGAAPRLGDAPPPAVVAVAAPVDRLFVHPFPLFLARAPPAAL
jgi:hypothetical protein